MYVWFDEGLKYCQCQYIFPQHVKWVSHNKLYSPQICMHLSNTTVHVCILSHKMYSLNQDVKDLLHYFKSVHFLPPCNISLHFVLLNSAANSCNELTIWQHLFTSFTANSYIELIIWQKLINNLPKSLTDRPVLLSCLVFTSVAAIGHLQRKKVISNATINSPGLSSWDGENIKIPDNI